MVGGGRGLSQKSSPCCCARDADAVAQAQAGVQCSASAGSLEPQRLWAAPFSASAVRLRPSSQWWGPELQGEPRCGPIAWVSGIEATGGSLIRFVVTVRWHLRPVPVPAINAQLVCHFARAARHEASQR